MKRKSIIIAISLCLIAFSFVFVGFVPKKVTADSLSESIDKELENLDLTQLEDLFNGVSNGKSDFNTMLSAMLKGGYSSDYGSFFSYIVDIFLKDVFDTLPVFLSIIAIAILCAIIQNIKSAFLSEGVSEIIFFVCTLTVILLLSVQVLSIWNNAQKVIENIAFLSEIMSPIILTLMVASGGNVSASIYKPTVAFLSNGIINIVSNIVFPLVGLLIIFSIINCFSKNIKLLKFSDFITGIIKWVIGLSFTIYGLFVSVQGIAGATFDGVSIKAAKYAISNSIPIIGGYLRDGFDLMVAGSILIKNAIGVVGIFAIFYIVISPVLHMAVISLLLKFTSAIIEPISDGSISNLCMSFSKGITYVVVCVLSVGFLLFVTVLLMMFSANAFI